MGRFLRRVYPYLLAVLVVALVICLAFGRTSLCNRSEDTRFPAELSEERQKIAQAAVQLVSGNGESIDGVLVLAHTMRQT